MGRIPLGIVLVALIDGLENSRSCSASPRAHAALNVPMFLPSLAKPFSVQGCESLGTIR